MHHAGLLRSTLVASMVSLLAVVGTGCAPGDAAPIAAGGSGVGETRLKLTAEVELERVTAIRDVAAGEGLDNGALLAGIAESETHLVHCWSEATWACQGPSSPSCGGGPVIAGAGDGACSLHQGGLGMFQFDGGTYEDTLARDGEDILLLEGNIAHAVEFVAGLVIDQVDGVDDMPEALAWLNAVPLEAGDPLMEQYADVIVCGYNGCCSDASICVERRDAYRDNAIHYFDKYGPAFWSSPGGECAPITSRGRVIDDSDPCYQESGDPQFWRRVATGYGGTQSWTMATDLDHDVNAGTWNLDFQTAGSYRVEVHLDGGDVGQARMAAYHISHAGDTDVVTLDQSAASGWVSLGSFAFEAGPGQSVHLGDATGESSDLMRQLAFDAIRVTPVNGVSIGDGDDDADGDGGGCRLAASSNPPVAVLALVLLSLGGRLSRRRRDARGRRGSAAPGRR